jgi:hypothetical protein
MVSVSSALEIYAIENFLFRLNQGYRLLIPYRFLEPPIGKARQSRPSPFESLDHKRLGQKRGSRYHFLLRRHKHEDKEHRSPGE